MTPRRRPTPAILRPRPATTVDFALEGALALVRPDPSLELGGVLRVVSGPALVEPLVRVGRELGERTEPLEHRGSRPVQFGAVLVRTHPTGSLELAIVQAVHLGVAVGLTDPVELPLGDLAERASGVRAPERDVPHHVPHGPALGVEAGRIETIGRYRVQRRDERLPALGLRSQE